MVEVLLPRQELFISRRMITHIATNLNGDEIEETYAIRVRSRLREQFNLIAYPFNAKDKRA